MDEVVITELHSSASVGDRGSTAKASAEIYISEQLTTTITRQSTPKNG